MQRSENAFQVNMYKFIYVYVTFWNPLNEERVWSEDEPRGDYGI